MKEKTFQQWTEDTIKFELGLNIKKKCELLDDWFNPNETIEEDEKKVLKKLITKASDYINAWNEQELQTKFIAPITELVNFDNLDYYFSAFSERKIEANYKGVSLKGKVDWMVAIGKSDPYIPFFFIHEYKKERGQGNDPRGQLLATMLAAHVLNESQGNKVLQPTLFNPFPKHDKDMPIYGCYIIGRWWYFVVLYKGEYCVSKPQDSLEEEILFKIVKVLKKQKRLIIEKIERSRASKL